VAVDVAWARAVSARSRTRAQLTGGEGNAD
jgi:hypothetical protein